MSASRMPAFSPSAAKPSARLQEVVDLPTPPLPDATAMTCLMPGIAAALEVARACGLGGGDKVLFTNRRDRFFRHRARANSRPWSSRGAVAARHAGRILH